MPDECTQAAPKRRYLSRHIIVDGYDRGLSVVTAIVGETQRVIAVEAYEGETPATAYLDAPIIITAGIITSPPDLP